MTTSKLYVPVAFFGPPSEGGPEDWRGPSSAAIARVLGSLQYHFPVTDSAVRGVWMLRWVDPAWFLVWAKTESIRRRTQQVDRVAMLDRRDLWPHLISVAQALRGLSREELEEQNVLSALPEPNRTTVRGALDVLVSLFYKLGPLRRRWSGTVLAPHRATNTEERLAMAAMAGHFLGARGLAVPETVPGPHEFGKEDWDLVLAPQAPGDRAFHPRCEDPPRGAIAMLSEPDRKIRGVPIEVLKRELGIGELDRFFGAERPAPPEQDFALELEIPRRLLDASSLTDEEWQAHLAHLASEDEGRSLLPAGQKIAEADQLNRLVELYFLEGQLHAGNARELGPLLARTLARHSLFAGLPLDEILRYCRE